MSHPSSSPSQQPAPTRSSGQLAEARDLNVQAQDKVEQSASELLVINAVLKQELPDYIQTGEVAQALQKTDELEGKIQETAADLAFVNAVLSHEIHERVSLERELDAAKAALAHATSEQPARQDLQV